MDKNKFNPTGERHSAWDDVALQEEMLRQQQEELMRRQLELAQQKQDLSRYDDSQDKAFFDNLKNIKDKFPDLSVEHMERYAIEIRDKNSEISKLESLLDGNMPMSEYHQVKQQIKAARDVVESREKMLNALLDKKKENGYGGRADIIDEYIESIINGGKAAGEMETSKNDADSIAGKALGPEPAPEKLIGLNGEELEKEAPLQKETPEEKIRRLGEALGWSDEEINKRIDAFSNSDEANHDEDKKVDNPPTSLEEQFDEAVRNEASADELSKIRREFYEEGQIQNGGKFELKDEYVDKYAIMSRVISAQREAEKPVAADSDKKLETEKPLTRREKLKKWGKRVLGSALALAAIIGVGSYVADDMQKDNSTESKTEYVDKNQDRGQVADAKDKVNEFVADGETGAENLTNNGRYDKQNDTYWSQMNLKRNGEDIGNISTFGEKSPEEILEMHRNGSLEDNLSYQAQFMFMDGLAEKYFGISANEAQDLYSRAQNGDQEAFKKINDSFKKMTAEVDRFEWAGNVPANFSSFFGDMDESGHITMSTAHGLNFEDKMLNMVLNDGTVVSIDGTCTQIIIKGVVVELPQIKGFTPPVDVVIPPAIINPPTPTPAPPTTTTPTPPTTTTPTPPTTTTPTPPTTTTEAPKDRSKEAPGTYNGVTPAEAGEETPPVSTEEQNNSIDPNDQPGDNVDGVMAPGAEPAPAQTEEVVVQYSGEWTVDPAVQQQQIQQQQAQEQANQNADQSAKVEEVQVGDQSVSLDEIRQAQQQTTTNGN